jgi:hypothetical protein
MNRIQLFLNMMASYRAWREAQRVYAQAVESEDQAAIAAAEETLHEAYNKYKPCTEPRRSEGARDEQTV